MSALPDFSAAKVPQIEEEEEPSHKAAPEFPVPASARLTHLAQQSATTSGTAVAGTAAAQSASATSSAVSAASSFNSLISPSPATSFLAQPMIASFPPDTMGAVGVNHVMSVSNDEIVVRDRLGHQLKTTNLNAFWDAAFPDISPAWDPNLRYDPYAKRWIFVCMGNYSFSSSSMLIAVSATDDPTGNWYLHRIFSDSNSTTFDHPRVGFNKNWIVVTGNQVDNASPNNWLYSVVYAFDKADLYGNGSKPPVEWNNITSDFTLTPATTYDPDESTMYLMANYNGNSSGAGFLSLSTITGAVGSEQLSLNVAFPSTSNTWASTVPQNFAPQLGSPQGIGVFDARLNSVVFRNGSLWATHTVFVPAAAPTISAVDWWQVGTDGSVQQFGRLQDPNAVFFYTYPTLSVNSNGDMLVGYSRMAASQYASAAYAFRAANDAAGTLRAEYVMQSGQAPYVILDDSGINRWGDYSATQVDPVNDLDFWTIQEYAAADQSGSRWAMWWANITTPALPLPTLQSLSLNPASVTGGQSSTGTVTLSSAAPSGGVTVVLSSDNGAAQIPSSVLVDGGHTTATLTIATSAVGSSTSATISASYNGDTVTAQLTVVPPALRSVSLNPNSVIGGQSCTGTLTLNAAAPSGGLTVDLSSDQAAAQLPATVVVQGGATTATFTISTSVVPTSTTATISAGFNGGTVTAQLTIDPVPLVMTPSGTTVSLRPGGTATLTLNLVSTTYAGKISFTVATDSPEITASASPVSLTAGQSASSTVTITASRKASNHRPALPGKTGAVIAFAVVLGSPFTLRRKRLLGLMLASIMAVAFVTSCATDPVRQPAARSYTVTVTPSAEPPATPALAPVQVNVTVQ